MIKYFSPSIPTCYLSTKKIRKQRAIKINLKSERIQISRIWNKKYVDDGVGVENVYQISSRVKCTNIMESSLKNSPFDYQCVTKKIHVIHGDNNLINHTRIDSKLNRFGEKAI